MPEIKGKGLPTRKTEGALGDIYVDTNTGVKYKCTGAFGVTTHAESTKEYEWKPIRAVGSNQVNQTRPVEEKPHETPKKQIKTKAKPVDKPVENAESKTETQAAAPHNYAKHFDAEKKAE